MAWDPDLQNNNQIGSNPYTPGGYEKATPRKILLIMVAVLAAIAMLLFIIHLSQPESQESKYIKSATIAARKHTPHAKVTNVKVAGGYATALVSGPTAQGQANAGNTTLFKVNKDGSMVQIAKGSSFGPLDLLEFGVPIATQAKLTGTGIGSVQQNLANQCGYSDDAIGFRGFGGSFNPGQWQIDSATLSSLEQKLSDVLGNQNVQATGDKSVVCVDVTQKNSNLTTDKTTYVSTFTLQVRFITRDGRLTMHTVTFAIGPNHYRAYTLDGQSI